MSKQQPNGVQHSISVVAKEKGNGNPACPTCNLNAELSGPDINHLRWSCPTKGNNCEKKKKSSLSSDAAAAYASFENAYNTQTVGQWFGDHSTDYTTIFPPLTDWFLSSVRDNSIVVTKTVNDDGSSVYVFTDQDVDPAHVTANDVYFAFLMEN